MQDQFVAFKKRADQIIVNQIAQLQKKSSHPSIEHLNQSVAYSLSSGGHRIRPLIVMLTAQCLGKDIKIVEGLASAIEFVHTYSLVHDDLPCMDDDDMRRGKPSNHKVFGEGMAVLAGDVLVTEAFMLLTDAYGSDPALAVDLVRQLSSASGISGMVGGQASDIYFKENEASTEDLEYLHENKTGRLFEFCVLGAARVCHATSTETQALKNYSQCLGLVFQISDDLTETDPGSEANFVNAVGMEKARARCIDLVEQGKQALSEFGSNAQGLKDILQHVYERTL